MLVVPASLYQLTAKDLLGAPVIRRANFLTGIASGAATEVVAGFTTPSEEDQVLVVQNWYATCSPGAAQNFRSIDLRLIEANQLLGFIAGDYNANPIAAAAWRGSGPVLAYVFAGESIEAHGFFDAAVAVNSVQACLQGFIIPRGTLQR